MRPATSLLGSSKGSRLFTRREMKIGKKNLPLSQKRKLGRQRFLHFHDHFRFRPNVVGKIDNLGAGLFVIRVGITRTDSGIFFDQDGVAAFGQLFRSRGQQRDTLLLFLNFLWNPDDHLQK
jgi:hypothetical protein